jgi:hypothetical protein
MRSAKELWLTGTLGLAFLAAGGSARAQSGVPAPPPPPGDGENAMYWVNTPEEEAPPPPIAIEIIGVEGAVGGKVVTGAPFTASFSSETTQALADGNRIQNKSTGTLARDAQGRTRRDMTVPGIGPWASSNAPKQISLINDPVSGNHYVLDPETKVAHQMIWKKGEHAHGHGGPGAEARKPADDANVVKTSLGTQTINGVSAEGERITRTIPAGAIGNQLPIVITTERWYSSELQTVVMTKRSDPRMGDSVMQLANIVRQTPDASLFQVPADYTVKQGRPGGHMFHKQVPPPPAE